MRQHSRQSLDHLALIRAVVNAAVTQQHQRTSGSARIGERADEPCLDSQVTHAAGNGHLAARAEDQRVHSVRHESGCGHERGIHRS